MYVQMMDHPVALKGVPFEKVTCKCGYEGKSQYPEHYQCSACYWTNRANSNEKKAAALRARADRLMELVARDRAQADKFRKKPR